MKFSICIKSGTCGHEDYDQCDLLVKENIETDQLPTNGEYISLSEKDKNGWWIETKYLVMEVVRSYVNDKEFNTVYVIKV